MATSSCSTLDAVCPCSCGCGLGSHVPVYTFRAYDGSFVSMMYIPEHLSLKRINGYGLIYSLTEKSMGSGNPH